MLDNDFNRDNDFNFKSRYGKKRKKLKAINHISRIRQRCCIKYDRKLTIPLLKRGRATKAEIRAPKSGRTKMKEDSGGENLCHPISITVQNGPCLLEKLFHLRVTSKSR